MTHDKAENGTFQDRLQERELSRALREAYVGSERPQECPPAERFFEWAEGQLADDEAEALRRHTEACGVCQAEVELAKAFSHEDSGATSEPAVERLVRDLERQSPLRKRAPALPLLAAAAATLLVAIGLVTLGGRQEQLPAPGDLTTVRGTALGWETVLGDEIQAPRELRWTPLERADRYLVEIVRVDETVVWRQELRATEVVLPESVREELEAHVRYRARVMALDADGTELSRSGSLDFSLREDRDE